MSQAEIPYKELLSEARRTETKALEMLGDLVRFPTCAARDRKTIVECADHVEAQLKAFGYSAWQYRTKGSPVVYAEKDVGARRSLLLYHHYDVQPEDPLELWKSDPWKLEVRDGRVFGRGVVDNKGPYVADLLGMEFLERMLGRLPVNLKFLVEGEEEVGSEHLADFAREKADFLRADGAVNEFLVSTPGSPSEIYCGVKGDVYFELKAHGSPTFTNRDVHSGYANAVPNAAWRLVWALNTLKDKDDRVTIDGWDSLVRDISEEDRAALGEYSEDLEAATKSDYGLGKTLLGRKGLELVEYVFMRPSVTISGIGSGYQGPGSKTIVPCSASAKVDVRLVPDLTPDKAEELLKAHLVKRGFDDIQVTRLDTAFDPSKTPITDPYIQLVRKCSEEVVSPARASVLPMGSGSGPVELFARYAPTCFAASRADSLGTNLHAPNESWPVASLSNEMAFLALVAQRLGSS
jgi:acetylornithine deacetylase/succinyl-diaminopimelate desuccinylase-like protein